MIYIDSADFFQQNIKIYFMLTKNISLVTVLLLLLVFAPIQSQNNCVLTPNTYWTGYRCACKVGYKNQSKYCIPLMLQKTKGWVVRQPLAEGSLQTSIQKPINVPAANNNCYLPNEFFNGFGCACLQGYTRIKSACQLLTTNNTAETKCPLNSNPINGSCQCLLGYTKVNNSCIISNSACNSNSYDNGLGFCVCSLGFYRENGTCVAGKPCPPFSTRRNNNECDCNAGFTKFGDYCSQCPLRETFDSISKKCVFVCGVNSAYNSTEKKCYCFFGFGIFNNACEICPLGFFIQNNYCVTCPINSVYSENTKRCECVSGFTLNQFGICAKSCGNNQIYNPISLNCECVKGLGRFNGVCQICPSSFAINTIGNCIQCSINQTFVDGRCACINGYISNNFGSCVLCSSRAGAFLLSNGQCAICPGQLIYNGEKCRCPAGKTRLGSMCKQNCKDDQLIDDAGLCYTCPIYQVKSEGRCICQRNHIRNSITSQCELSCPGGQFKYQGRCAQCPLNLQYRIEISGCACRDGEYLNTYGICQKINLIPITCRDAEYLDINFGCLPCPFGCKSCLSSSICNACLQEGFTVFNGICQARCGDGLIATGEQCDDRNTNNADGCSSACRIQPNFLCSGIPSICTSSISVIPVCGNGRLQSGQTCDDGNLFNGDGCSNRCQIQSVATNPVPTNLTVIGNIISNTNTVNMILKTSKPFKFANENEMFNFIQARFPNLRISPPLASCTQRQAPDLDLFECFVLFNSGIPNQRFKIQFSYNYQGERGFLEVDVNPLTANIPNRARRR